MADESETPKNLDEPNYNELLPQTESSPETKSSEQEKLTLENPDPAIVPEAFKATPNNELDILNEQFNNYMRIAKALLTTLRRPKDIEICNNLLRKIQTLSNSKHVEVKRNNNRFFRYCLLVLKRTSEMQPLDLYQHLYKRGIDDNGMAIVTEKWLVENNFYIASKSYKDGTFVLYTAVAKNPDAGWQWGGLQDLESKSVCENSRNAL